MKRKQMETVQSRIVTTRVPRVLLADHLERIVGGEGGEAPKRPNFYDDSTSTKRPD